MLARGSTPENPLDRMIDLQLNMIDLHRQALGGEDPLLRLVFLAIVAVLLVMYVNPTPSLPMLRRIVVADWLVLVGVTATWLAQPFANTWAVPTAWMALITAVHTVAYFRTRRRHAAQPVATADLALFSIRDGEAHVLLIERRYEPFKGKLAIPGGHAEDGEAVEYTALRELEEETGLTATRMCQVGIFGAPGRDPRGRYVTTLFAGEAERMDTPTAGDDASVADWYPVKKVLESPHRFAFDHHSLLVAAAERVRADRLPAAS